MKTSPPRPVLWEGATKWWGGTGALAAGLRGALQGRVRIVFDTGFAESEAGHEYLDGLMGMVRRATSDVEVWEHCPSGTSVDAVHATSAIWRRQPADTVLMVGGGSTLDFGLLASLDQDQLTLLERAKGRCGLVLLAPPVRQRGRRALRVAIPTTVGTGAEVSAAACVDRAGEKMLIIGTDLRPDIAVCDPEATRGLSPRQLRESIIEVLGRLVVPYAGPAQEHSHPIAHQLSDHILVGNLHALLRVGEKLAQDGELDDDGRLALAAASAHSHAGWAQVGRAPNASPVWFIATELSRAIGVPKAVATAMLLPAWASIVLHGDERWGDAARLQDLTNKVLRESGLAVMPADIWMERLVTEVLHLVDDPPTQLIFTRDQVAREVAFQCVRRWGGGLPILIGLRGEQIEMLVTGALACQKYTERMPAC